MLTQDFILHAPFGPIALTLKGDRFVRINLTPSDERVRLSPIAPSCVADEFEAYFDDPTGSILSSGFSISSIKGTVFQQRVWEIIRLIPCGETRTYGDIAKEMNSFSRAIGNACRANPLPLIIPCHRVVSARGSGGFCGSYCRQFTDIKLWLLRHESAITTL